MCLPSKHLRLFCVCVVQVQCQTISETLEQTRQSLNQYLQDSEGLNSHISQLQQQHAAVLDDKAHVLQENARLGSSISELRQTVQELEATRDQLEADRYTAQTSLEKLEQAHEQVCYVWVSHSSVWVGVHVGACMLGG